MVGLSSVSHPVLVMDFGAQYAQLIARRVRELGIKSELVPCGISAKEIVERQPAAIILSGGPASVYSAAAPSLDPLIFQTNIPIFGICYGFQLMAQYLGGLVSKTNISEFGCTEFKVVNSHENKGVLFTGLPDSFKVWMSHTDQVVTVPSGFSLVGSTEAVEVAAFENLAKKYAGVQFHPEVIHTDFGKEILKNYLTKIVEVQTDWNAANLVDLLERQIKTQIGNQKAICALSGGVDSAVAAALVQKAIGKNLVCVFVDHGLLRENERAQVEKDFVAATGAKLVVLEAQEIFLDKLAGVIDPEAKRKIIGELFIRTFETAVDQLVSESAVADDFQFKFLVQGTLYPDVVESGGEVNANIKTHHNVGGLPTDLKFELVEPLRWLFKDEVRAIGRAVGLPENIINRQPFPGPGLAIRIIGAVTAERLDILRKADAIVRAELSIAGLDNEIWQCPVVLLADVKSVGVQGDRRSYGYPIVLRPVVSEDAMTADWARLPGEILAKISTRITNEVPQVNRVVLDITSKPPGTIEWE